VRTFSFPSFIDVVMAFRFRASLVVAVLVAVGTIPLCAQPLRPGATATPRDDRSGVVDTVRLVYDFEPGESVTYRVTTVDTLFFHGANSFIQAAERTYHVTWRCDSITYDGIAMTMSYGGYVAREWRDTFPGVVRTAHPWTDRTFSMLMNDDGRRIRFLSSTDTPAVSPAGPFQPMLMPYLGEPWTRVGASQQFELNHWLLDNVAPSILYGGSVFRTVVAREDTLGVPTVLLSIAETGRAKYLAPNASETAAIINGAARIWFSPMLGFPVAGDFEATTNLTLTAPNGDLASGRQMIRTHFAMVPPDEALNGALR
jgi:hypothetical protein